MSLEDQRATLLGNSFITAAGVQVTMSPTAGGPSAGPGFKLQPRVLAIKRSLMHVYARDSIQSNKVKHLWIKNTKLNSNYRCSSAFNFLMSPWLNHFCCQRKTSVCGVQTFGWRGVFQPKSTWRGKRQVSHRTGQASGLPGPAGAGHNSPSPPRKEHPHPGSGLHKAAPGRVGTGPREGRHPGAHAEPPATGWPAPDRPSGRCCF